jgi:hypothetical protein
MLQDRAAAEDVIAEMQIFPKSKHDDLTDSTTQALQWLRNQGLLQTDEETRYEELRAVMHKPRLKPLYPV